VRNRTAELSQQETLVSIYSAPGNSTMLVLSRKKDEKIVIGDNISIMVVEIRGDKVRLGIEAPREISVHRREVYDAIKRKEAEETEPESTPAPEIVE
jgi:carbon storage regulator